MSSVDNDRSIKINLLLPQHYVKDQPHDQFDWLRMNAPVYQHPLPDGGYFWAITRYDDVVNIGRDSDNFSSKETVIYPNHGCSVQGDKNAQKQMLKDEHHHHNNHQASITHSDSLESEPNDYSMMIMMDPPKHTQYRKLISKDFSPLAISEWEHSMSEIARSVFNQAFQKKRFDFVSDVSGKFSGQVMATLLGLPTDDASDLYHFTEIFHSMPGTLTLPEIDSRVKSLESYIISLRNRKRHSIDNDLTKRILDGKIAGKTLSDEDSALQIILMINGGTDTTRNLLSLIFYHLLIEPTWVTWIREDIDQRIPLIREEYLRWFSPIIYQCRTAINDISINEVVIKKGDLVALYFGCSKS